MRRPQFTLRALLVSILVVAAFFGGIQCERYRYEREQWNRGLEFGIRKALKRKEEARKRLAHQQASAHFSGTPTKQANISALRLTLGQQRSR